MTGPVVRLTRFLYGEDCTLGHLVVGASSAAPQLIYTLEDPWRDNAPGESCIPDGLYQCVPSRFNAGGYPAIEITGVPNRSLIKFHKGNRAEDVRGCIVVGATIGVLEGDLAVRQSAAAWVRFIAELGGAPFQLDIAPLWPLAGAKR